MCKRKCEEASLTGEKGNGGRRAVFKKKKKTDGKNIMKPQKALKGTVTNLDLNHMLLISLYGFLDVDSFTDIRQVIHWQPA